jgi:hypothetical protein
MNTLNPYAMRTYLLSAILALLCCCNWAIGQIDIEYNEVVKNAPFIFEGEVIDYYKIVQGENDQYFLSYTLRIEKVLRGTEKLKKGNIEIVTELPDNIRVIETDGELSTIALSASHSSPDEKHEVLFSKGSNGIFFCNELGEYPSFNASTENLSVQPYCLYSDCYINLSKTKNELNHDSTKVTVKSIPTGLNKTFNSVDEVYEYLDQFQNIVVEKEPDNKNLKKSDSKKKDASGSLDAISKENQIKYAQRQWWGGGRGEVGVCSSL